MKASKFTDAQKAFILKQGADGHPVAEICRKAGISVSAVYAPLDVWVSPLLQRSESRSDSSGGDGDDRCWGWF